MKGLHAAIRRAAPTLCAALAVAAIVGALASCGVPEDSIDRPVRAADVQFGLLDPVVSTTTTSTTTTTTRVSPSIAIPTTTMELYFIDFYLIQNQRLVAVRRPTRSKPTVTDALDALMRPTFEEAVGGRRSELTDTDIIVSATSKGGSATVALGEPFSSMLGSDQLLAIGQIVYTLTEVAGIGSVAFTLGGNTLEVPGVDGGLIKGPVSRDDLVTLVATPPTSTIFVPGLPSVGIDLPAPSTTHSFGPSVPATTKT